MNKLVNRLYEENNNDLPDTVEEVYKQGLQDMINNIVRDHSVYVINPIEHSVPKAVIANNRAQAFEKLNGYRALRFEIII